MPLPLSPGGQYLTGERGTAPAAGWDPLEFAVAEAHRPRYGAACMGQSRFASPTGKVPAAAQVANGKGKFDPVCQRMDHDIPEARRKESERHGRVCA